MKKKAPLYIVDGSSILYRSFYGLPPLYNSKGVCTHAVFGFFRTLKKELLGEIYAAIAWDSPGRTVRKEKYEQYKAHRLAAPSELISQKEIIQEAISYMNIPQYSLEGYEADDIIAKIVQEYEGAVVIVSSDKDLYQLLSKKVTIKDPFKNQLLTQESVEEKMGFPIAHFPLYYALVGDSSDNIPGVKGIGPKQATVCAKQYETLEEMYEHLDTLPSKTAALLEKDKENAFLSKELFLLSPPLLPLNLPTKPLCLDDVWDAAEKIWTLCEFESFIKNKKKEIKAFEYKVIEDKEELLKEIEKARAAKSIAFDTETDGEPPLSSTCVGISFCYSSSITFYVPLVYNKNGTLEDRRKELLPAFASLFEDESVEKLFHNAKFDLLVLHGQGYQIKGKIKDTLIAASLLQQEAWSSLGLKALSVSVLEEDMESFSDLMKGKEKIYDIEIEKIARYGAHDALQTFKLFELFKEKLSQEKLTKLFEDLEMPTMHVLYSMEKRGIQVRPEVFKEAEKKLLENIISLEEGIRTILEKGGVILPEDFNFQSPRQVSSLLFEKLGLPPVKKNEKGGHSTDHKVLQVLSKLHPIPHLFLKHRECAKLLSYAQQLPLMICPHTGRIHTTYNQAVVATGRLSSNDPNLQNIPVGGEYGQLIRSAFVAPEGSVFISADYSQIELRILAHLSKDARLLQSFREGEDIHARTACHLFKKEDPSEITSEQRQVGKKINFSVLYGLTPYGLSTELGISVSEAKSYIDSYFSLYEGVAKWMEQTIAFGKKHGYVQTLYGRRRYLPHLLEKNKHLEQAACRAAVNTPVQGTSAELVKLAMIDVHVIMQRIYQDTGAIVLQIHDEIVVEIPLQYEQECGNTIKKIMEEVADWEIPLEVSLRSGKTWAEVTK